MTDAHQCSVRVFGERVQSWPCPNRGKVKRDGKWFCGVHDPERRVAAEQQRNEHQKASSRNFNEGLRLARRLGIDGAADYHHLGPFSQHGYRRSLVIAFEDVEKILKELGRADHLARVVQGMREWLDRQEKKSISHAEAFADALAALDRLEAEKP